MTDKIKYGIQPISPKSAQNTLKIAYAQMNHDLSGVHEPFLVHSPAEDVLLGLWSVYRESLLASGLVRRDLKEAITVTISMLNRCPWCIDAHTVSLNAVGAAQTAEAIAQQNTRLVSDKKMAAIIEWAQATRTPTAAILQTPPFSDTEAPEIIGTAIVYHYLTRVVNVLLVESWFPSQKWLKTILQKFAGVFFTRFTRQHIPQGETLALLSASPLLLDFAWANSSPAIAGAFARFAAVIENAGQRTLPIEVRQVVQHYVNEWQGADPGISRQWVEKVIQPLESHHKPLAKLVLLAAIAPHQVEDTIIAAFRSVKPDDQALIDAVAWGSFSAAHRIGSWLALPKQPAQASTVTELATV